MSLTAVLALLLLASGCRNKDPADDTGQLACEYYADVDGDGWGGEDIVEGDCDGTPPGASATPGDCNDDNAAVHPGQNEVPYDGMDNDCDESTPEDDLDADGFAVADDCDDQDPAVSPDATEVCNDIDDDCDGQIDDEIGLTFYADSDGDGYGDPESPVLSCDESPGAVADDQDCDDGDDDVNPAAEEICNGLDDDCDDLVDDEDDPVTGTSTWYTDADADGHGDPDATLQACEEPESAAASGDDCDDDDPTVHPDADEVCDGLDNDCDGLVDDDDPVVTDPDSWWIDVDGDGYGGTTYETQACEAPSGFSSSSDDCDDSDATVFPGAEEVCDGADNDCDGSVDLGATDMDTWYVDNDGDGHGDPAAAVADCDGGSGLVATDADCDDADAAVNPDAAEVCDGVDNDCNGLADDDDPGVTDSGHYYSDSDGDGAGDPATETVSCVQPAATITDASDCDDTDPAVNPSATETCNGIDDDCDALVDDDDPGLVGASTWYLDYDGDGYGNADWSYVTCEAPSGTVADDQDCDDAQAEVNPGAAEVCDGVDNDCDGTTDTGAADPSTWYDDTDGDGFGDLSAASQACDAGSGQVADSTDCDDTDSAVHPDAEELCDGIDNDCDGGTDLGASDAITQYLDHDGDGFGDASLSTTDCAELSSYVEDATDCDDLDALVNPDGVELCNGYDDDCDGTTDEDDADDVLAWYVDDDSDGYGTTADVTLACDEPSGFAANADDCDDTDGAIHPAADEDCDGVDNDCDGGADADELGADAACAAPSCLDVLLELPGTGDGDYWITLDTGPAETTCDMTTDGGGWTLLFEDDFEGSPDTGWSTSGTTTCSGWGGTTLLGGYGVIAGGELDIEVDLHGVPHTEAWADLIYAHLDSWDSEDGYVALDGSEVWSDNPSWWWVFDYECGDWAWPDQDSHVSEIVSHGADSLTLLAGSDLDESSTNESFGLDDVTVWVR